MSGAGSVIVQFPGGVCRSREAERLLDRYVEIRNISSNADKVAALFEWRQDVDVYSDRFPRLVK